MDKVLFVLVVINVYFFLTFILANFSMKQHILKRREKTDVEKVPGRIKFLLLGLLMLLGFLSQVLVAILAFYFYYHLFVDYEFWLRLLSIVLAFILTFLFGQVAVLLISLPFDRKLRRMGLIMPVERADNEE